jgi:hypothetical protein
MPDISRDHGSHALNGAPLTISQGQWLSQRNEDLNGMMRVQVDCLHAPDIGEHVLGEERCPSPAVEHERVRHRIAMVLDARKRA